MKRGSEFLPTWYGMLRYLCHVIYARENEDSFTEESKSYCYCYLP